MERKGIIETKPATLATVKDVLSERKKEGELTFEQKVSLDYAKEFSKGKEKAIGLATTELQSMGIDEATIVRIINVAPETREEVKLIFEKTRFDLKEDHINKILDLVKTL
jgi:DNA-directed RNA polymerase subunit F